MDDITTLDATAQAELVRSGAASPAELVDAAIAGLERVNPQLNAVIHERYDQAREEAAGELPDGPFRGVPMVVKDLMCVHEGEPLHEGLGYLKRVGHVADATTGKIVKKLTSPNSDSHFDAISFINSAGAWSPDGKKFAFVVYADGDQQIQIYDVASGHTDRRIRFTTIGAISDVAWSPDGSQLALGGSWGGISDLYLYNLESGKIDQLTHDKYGDLQPSWSPHGRSIAFSTYRPSRLAQ